MAEIETFILLPWQLIYPSNYTQKLLFKSTVTSIPDLGLLHLQTAEIYRAGGSGPTTPTLVGQKFCNLPSEVLCFQNFGRTNNCLVKVFLKWSDQSSTSSAGPDIEISLCCHGNLFPIAKEI